MGAGCSATTQSTGLPDTSTHGGARLVNAGTTTAHIMKPCGREAAIERLLSYAFSRRDEALQKRKLPVTP